MPQLIEFDNETRLLRKIISGIEMVYDPISLDAAPSANSKKKSKKSSQLHQLILFNRLDLLIPRILYIEAETPYSRVFFESHRSESIDFRISLQIIAQHFEAKGLIRIHRSYMVNPDKIVTVKKRGRDLQLKLSKIPHDKHYIPVGRSYVSTLMQKYPQWF